jgi:hypothetical protein
VDRAVKPGFVESADVIAGLVAYDKFGALLADALGDFDAAKGWDMDPYAAPSLRTFLIGPGRQSPAAASTWSTDSKWLHKQPVVMALALSGDLSRGQVDVIRTNVPAAYLVLFTEHAANIVPRLVGLSVMDTITMMHEWLAMAEAVVDTPEPIERPNTTHKAKLLDGKTRYVTELDALRSRTRDRAVALADSHDFSLTRAQRDAEAEDAIWVFYLNHHETARGRRNRPHIFVMFDAVTGNAVYDDGGPVSGPDLGMLMCDATLQRVMVAGSEIIDLGVKTYAATPPVWTTVAIRDQHCRFDSYCNAPLNRCDAHHVRRYPDGATNQFNLVLLCGKHHQRLHKPGWHAELDDDAAFHVTDPKGRTWTTHADGPSPAQQAKAKQVRRNAARAEAQRQKARNPRAHGPTSPPDTPPLFTDTR